MSTTLADLEREIGELGCRNPRIQQDIKAWINRAQRAISQQRNFTWMHSRQSVTITAGTTSANLPANFKCLSEAKSPVTYTSPTASNPTPVIVKSREELEQISPGFTGMVTNASGYWSPFYVFLEQVDGGLWTINTPSGYVHAQNAVYAVSCYLFPADLSLGTDTNALIADGELVEALLNKTRAMAYASEDPTDARAVAALQLYAAQISAACSQDARKKLAGRSIHW